MGLRHSLATIIGHIVHHFQQIRSHTHYNDVINLEDEIQRFVKNLPPHYAVEDPDTSLDETLPFIPVHRFIIVTEVFFVRISLHRPYLLRRLSSDRYLVSRRACFESAKQEYKIRQRFKKTMPPDVLRALGGAYREFQAAMIAGIALVLDVNGPDAPDMHEILDGFLRDHEGLHEIDATTRRELKIIEFLKRKAELGPDDPTLHGKFPGGGSYLQRALDGAQAQVQAQANASLLMGIGNPSFGPPISHHRASSINANGKPGLSVLSQGHFQGLQSTPSPRSPDQGNVSPHHSRQLSRGGLSGSSGGGFTPPNEDAQNLLDNWCNSVINSSGLASDIGLLDTGIPWPVQTPGPFSYVPPAAPIEGTIEVDESTTSGLNGYEADWNYWETIVSAISRDGGSAPT